MAEDGWWIRWSDGGESDDDLATLWYFRGDQSRGARERERYQIFLNIELGSVSDGDANSNAWSDGGRYYSARVYWGEHGDRLNGYIDVDEIGDTNQWRFRIRNSPNHMSASLIRAGVHGVLDCLEDTVFFYTGGDCDFIVDFGSFGLQPLAVADDGTLGNSATTTKGDLL